MFRNVRRLMISSALCALSVAALGGEKHSLLGTWSVDVAKIQQPDKPKSVTLTLAEAGPDSYHMVVTIEAADGSKSTAEGTFKPDGSANRVDGSQDIDVASATMPSKRMLVMGTGFSGHPASTHVWTLSDDGTHMIEIAIRHLPDGTPYQRVFTWTRK
jgi:hypothetical protein